MSTIKRKIVNFCQSFGKKKTDACKVGWKLTVIYERRFCCKLRCLSSLAGNFCTANSPRNVTRYLQGFSYLNYTMIYWSFACFFVWNCWLVFFILLVFIAFSGYSSCGVSPVDFRSRIVGGKNSKKGWWPWHVGIYNARGRGNGWSKANWSFPLSFTETYFIGHSKVVRETISQTSFPQNSPIVQFDTKTTHSSSATSKWPIKR